MHIHIQICHTNHRKKAPAPEPAPETKPANKLDRWMNRVAQKDAGSSHGSGNSNSAGAAAHQNGADKPAASNDGSTGKTQTPIDSVVRYVYAYVWTCVCVCVCVSWCVCSLSIGVQLISCMYPNIHTDLCHNTDESLS